MRKKAGGNKRGSRGKIKSLVGRDVSAAKARATRGGTLTAPIARVSKGVVAGNFIGVD